jgi:hypothetical protein
MMGSGVRVPAPASSFDAAFGRSGVDIAISQVDGWGRHLCSIQRPGWAACATERRCRAAVSIAEPAYFGGVNLAGKAMLDPFVGGGTSVIEARRLGARAVGLDIDPVAVAVSSIETRAENTHRIVVHVAAAQRSSARPSASGGPTRRDASVGGSEVGSAAGAEPGPSATRERQEGQVAGSGSREEKSCPQPLQKRVLSDRRVPHEVRKDGADAASGAACRRAEKETDTPVAVVAGAGTGGGDHFLFGPSSGWVPSMFTQPLGPLPSSMGRDQFAPVQSLGGPGL